MSASRQIDPETLRKQRAASDPTQLAFVSAIAGSGKTHVLTQRIKRLLLSGVEPQRILCLTFTKAAAANMANRLLSELGAFVGMDDAALRMALAGLDDRPRRAIGAGELKKARSIFAAAIETPGGLKIQTIHAFCDALLHQFPFEAGVPANFRELDAATEEEFFKQAFREVMEEGLADPQGLIAWAIDEVTRLAGDERFSSLLRKAVAARAVIDEALPTLGEASALSARLRQALQIGDETRAGLEARILGEAPLPPSEWPALIAELRQVEGQPTNRAADFEKALRAREGAAQAQAYLAAFCTGKGTPYALRSVVTKELRLSSPRIAQILADELARLSSLVQQLWALDTHDMSLALAVLARAAIDRIEQAKRHDSFLAFDDLIAAANRLLDGRAGDWVRWKLDQGIEHILIDEAQDTSAAQWELIKRLSEEFFAGQGASTISRSLFVVGDDKQSIFSFQGAAPHLFDSERRRIARLADEARLNFRAVTLDLSFRSSRAVLQAVETIFADLQRLPGVTSDSAFPNHRCAREGVAGAVEIWPCTERAASVEIAGFDYPLAPPDASDPQQELADRIARRLAAAIGCESVDDKGAQRPLRAGDVLILVRRRNAFFEKMIRALKQKGLPVAGADRLKLTQHIAVMDMMALGKAALLPEDDLTFACLMKSPLLGFNEDDLFELAHKRGDNPLFFALKARAGERPSWQAGMERFTQWQEQAGAERPYEFFAHVLGRDGGRQAFAARLGAEAHDILSEFLAATLQFEQSHVPSLQGFLAWLTATEADVKREMDQGRDEVRVMTVHNAKGLEAKFVILADTTSVPRPQSDDRLLAGDDGRGPLLLWARGKDQEPDLVARARGARQQAMLAEYHRLFYVALTRAEDRLLIAGYPAGQKAPPPDSWYGLAEERLKPLCAQERDAAGAIIAWHFPARSSTEDVIAAPPAKTDQAPRPRWFSAPPPLPPQPRRALQPSRPSTTRSRAGRPDEATGGLLAKARGEVLHRLLQALPRVDEGLREKKAHEFIARELGEAGDGLAAEALAVLALPALRDILAGETMAEVPLIGDVILADGQNYAVSGRIDLLAVQPGRIAILDYKSGMTPQGAPPSDYVTQLALYRRLLETRFPDRRIDAFLLWTRVPRLDLLSPQAMEFSLTALSHS